MDTVVLTGEMRRGRADYTAEAREHGLRVTTSVCRRTSVDVAGNLDSLSGIARTERHPERTPPLRAPLMTACPAAVDGVA